MTADNLTEIADCIKTNSGILKAVLKIFKENIERTLLLRGLVMDIKKRQDECDRFIDKLYQQKMWEDIIFIISVIMLLMILWGIV